jgi:hypothetical protein
MRMRHERLLCMVQSLSEARRHPGAEACDGGGANEKGMVDPRTARTCGWGVEMPLEVAIEMIVGMIIVRLLFGRRLLRLAVIAHNRRPTRFSLRGLFIVVTATTVFLGILAYLHAQTHGH